MQTLILLLARVMLCCLGVLLFLPATTASDVSGVPSALVGVNVGHVDRGANTPAPLPPNDGSYPLMLAEVPRETDKGSVNASILTMLVLMVASWGRAFYGCSQTLLGEELSAPGALTIVRGWPPLMRAHPSLESSGSKGIAALSWRSRDVNLGRRVSLNTNPT